MKTEKYLAVAIDYVDISKNLQLESFYCVDG